MTELAEVIGTESTTGVDYGDFSFSCKRFVLHGLAEHASAAVSTSSSVPVLACFQVRVGPGLLRLAAMNMELTILAESQAVTTSVTGETVTYIPAKKLLAILKEAPDGDVTVAVKKNLATVTAAHGASWVLMLPDGDMFPELPDLDLAELHATSREKFLTGLKTVRHTVGHDAGRPPLMQVSIGEAELSRDKKNNPVTGMSVTSADGARFTRAPLPGFPVPMSIPAGALDHLIRLLSASAAEEVQVGNTEAALVFRVGNITLMVNRMMVQFPNMDQLLLKPAMDNKDILTVDRSELQAAIRRVRINANPDTSAIALQLADGQVTVESRHRHDSATETVMAGWSGGDRLLTVNHAYLMEMLNAHPSSSCMFKVGKNIGKRRSMVLLTDPEAGVTGIISQMPPGVVGY